MFFINYANVPITDGEPKNERCGEIPSLPPGTVRGGKFGIKAESTSYEAKVYG